MAQPAGEGTRRATQEAAESAKRATQDVAESAKRATQEVTEGARRIAEDMSEQAERGRRTVLAAAEIYNETAQLTAEDLQAIATCSTIAAGGMTDIRQAWMEWLNRSLRIGARATQQMLRSTTLEHLADAQRSFLKESFDNLLESSAEMLRISGRVSEDARRPIEERVTLRVGEHEQEQEREARRA